VEPGSLTGICPTGAIKADGGQLRLDQGGCILCGRCVRERPELFTWSRGAQTGTLVRQALVVPQVPETSSALTAARAELRARTAALRRSVHLRHVDAGSDGTEEYEIAALLNPVYDIHRLGIFFTASPRHADILLVTGAGVPGMAGPLRETYEGMPDPKVVIAVGTDAISGGLLRGADGADQPSGVGAVVQVDVWVPGSPPPPFSILHALLIATGRLAAAEGSRA
jgi:Ni,Fe-hydrogenase III small subunit/ferredoxin